MIEHGQPSILLYGKSDCFHIFQKELSSQYDFKIFWVEPDDQTFPKIFEEQPARLFVYDKKSANTDFVTTFLLKNPEIPIVCVQGETKPELEVSYFSFSRIETSGLPQVLKVFEDHLQPMHC